MGRRTNVLVLVLAGVLAACGGQAATGGTAAPRQSRDVITREQIDQMPVSSAYEVVQRMRPEYLRDRSANSALNRIYAVVYVDGIRRGLPDALRSIPANDVQEIRFINAIDAQQRYGPDHTGGVIEVTVRRG